MWLRHAKAISEIWRGRWKTQTKPPFPCWCSPAREATLSFAGPESAGVWIATVVNRICWFSSSDGWLEGFIYSYCCFLMFVTIRFCGSNDFWPIATWKNSLYLSLRGTYDTLEEWWFISYFEVRVPGFWSWSIAHSIQLAIRFSRSFRKKSAKKITFCW